MECKLKKISMACKCYPWYIPRNSEDNDKLPLCGRIGNQCFAKQLKRYHDEARYCKHCKDDCTMVHFFSTLQREPFSTNQLERDILFNPEKSTGMLSNYLMDPKRVFTDDLSRNITKFFYNFSSDEELAKTRFQRDIAVLNFFFDTPIITLIQLELKTTMFDMISAVGGTLGLFTGISVITIAEIGWWIWTFVAASIRNSSNKAKRVINQRRSTRREKIRSVNIFRNLYNFAI